MRFKVYTDVKIESVFFLSWRRRQHGSPKRWYPSTTLKSATTQKTMNSKKIFYIMQCKLDMWKPWTG